MSNEKNNVEGIPAASEPLGKIFHDFLCGLLSDKKKKGASEMEKTAYTTEVHLDDMGGFIANLYSEGYRLTALKIDMTGDSARDKGIAKVYVLPLDCHDRMSLDVVNKG